MEGLATVLKTLIDAGYVPDRLSYAYSSLGKDSPSPEDFEVIKTFGYEVGKRDGYYHFYKPMPRQIIRRIENVSEEDDNEEYECDDCGATVYRSESECSECGVTCDWDNVVEKKIKCEECGQPMKRDDNICPTCGAQVSETDDEDDDDAISNVVNDILKASGPMGEMGAQLYTKIMEGILDGMLSEDGRILSKMAKVKRKLYKELKAEGFSHEESLALVQSFNPFPAK